MNRTAISLFLGVILSAASALFLSTAAPAGHGDHHGGGHGGHHGGGHGGHHGGGHGGHHGGHQDHHGGYGGRHGGHYGEHRYHHGGREGHHGRHEVSSRFTHHAHNNFAHPRNAFGNRVAWGRWHHHHWRNYWGWGWPYFYGDVLTFAFWPYADYNPFWFYGPNSIFANIFWPYRGYWPQGYASPYEIYGHGAQAYAARHRRTLKGARPPSPEEAGACSGLAPGVTDLPIDRIEQAVHPTSDQMAALNDLKASSSKASDVLKASCPSEVPLTPVGRLDALQKRLNSMVEAVQIVRGPLRTFYDSLTDEQKQWFDAIGQNEAKGGLSNGLAGLCGEQSGNFTQLPLERIKQTLQPSQQQQAALDQLSTASSKAASDLEKSCPTEIPQNPAERLDAITNRLEAMIQAVNLVRPALNTFYLSLTDEQKARFNILGGTETSE